MDTSLFLSLTAVKGEVIRGNSANLSPLSKLDMLKVTKFQGGMCPSNSSNQTSIRVNPRQRPRLPKTIRRLGKSRLVM